MCEAGCETQAEQRKPLRLPASVYELFGYEELSIGPLGAWAEPSALSTRVTAHDIVATCEVAFQSLPPAIVEVYVHESQLREARGAAKGSAGVRASAVLKPGEFIAIQSNGGWLVHIDGRTTRIPPEVAGDGPKEFVRRVVREVADEYSRRGWLRDGWWLRTGREVER